MHKFIKFIELTNIEGDWIKLEKFMEINGKKIEESFPQNNKLYNDNNEYKLGLILEKKNDKIIFTTYTIIERKCAFNHQSVHTLEGNLKGGKINVIDFVDILKGY